MGIRTLIVFLGFILACQAQDVSLHWEYLDLGDYIGERGVIVGDFDGNGYQEMFVVANTHRDIMKIQFDGETYAVEGKLSRPLDESNEEMEIHSLAHMNTDTDYALVTTIYGDYVYIYDLVTLELVEAVDMEEADSSFFAGMAELSDIGAVYTVAKLNQLVAVHGNKDDGFYTKTYNGMAEYGGVIGSFTQVDLVEVVYSDGSIYQYNSEFDSFLPTQGFPYTLTSDSDTQMIKIDIDGDGVHEIVAHSGVGLECSSAIDFGLVWTFDVGAYLIMCRAF